MQMDTILMTPPVGLVSPVTTNNFGRDKVHWTQHSRYSRYSCGNLLSQAEDLVIFSGQNAITTNTLFQNGIVLNRGTPTDTGLLDLPPGTPSLPAAQIIQVKLKDPAIPGVYAE